MARVALQQVRELLERAFESGPEHSFIANVSSVDASIWHVVPKGGGRSVAGIAVHVATGQHVYQSHAFGEGLGWDEVFASAPAPGTPESLMAWARSGHELLVASVEGLDDDEELERPRAVHYMRRLIPTREILATVLEHDLYHAGEINHIRALLTGTDFWPGEA